MSIEEEDLITKHNMYLLYHLRPSVKRIIKYLHEEQAIDPLETERILSQAADTMKTQHLLEKLQRKTKGQQSLDYLYAATLFTKIWPAADVLDPKKKPHKEEEVHEKLPDKWPSDDHSQSLSKETLTVKPVEEKNTRMKEYFDNPKRFNVYEMNHEVKGRALIINNYKFEHLNDREGTLEDEKGLDIILTALKFDVKIERDLTAEEMEDVLKTECKVDHKNFNCFILVMMSHGDQGVVFGTNGRHSGNDKTNYVEINEIEKAFSKVESLSRKPKLFIIQACRGGGDEGLVTDQANESGRKGQQTEDEHRDENEEEGMEQKQEVKEGDLHGAHMNRPQLGVSPSNAATPGMSPMKRKVSTSDSDQDDAGEQESSENEDDGDSNDDENEEQGTEKYNQPLANTDDLAEGKPLHFLIALPTTEGNKSWRNTNKGSWFIQAFIYVLAKYACKEDLGTLMLKVNELVRRAGGRRKTEVPEFTSSLIKKLYFFPGMEKA